MTTVASPDVVAVLRDLLLDLVAADGPASPLTGWDLTSDSTPGQLPAIALGDAGWVRDADLGAFNPARVSLRAFAETEEQAAAGYRAASDYLHRVRNLTRAGVGIFEITDETGPQPVPDPSTRWALAFGVLDLVVADRLTS